MVSLDSELDIVISDEREIEELGRSLVSGKCGVGMGWECLSLVKLGFGGGFNGNIVTSNGKGLVPSFKEVFKEVFAEPANELSKGLDDVLGSNSNVLNSNGNSNDIVGNVLDTVKDSNDNSIVGNSNSNDIVGNGNGNSNDNGNGIVNSNDIFSNSSSSNGIFSNDNNDDVLVSGGEEVKKRQQSLSEMIDCGMIRTLVSPLKSVGRRSRGGRRGGMGVCAGGPVRWSRGDGKNKNLVFDRVQSYDVAQVQVSNEPMAWAGETYSCALPSVGVGPADGILRVSPEVVAELLRSEQSFFLVDCRFEYEFSGGHIRGAQNIMTMRGIKTWFQNLVAAEEGSGAIFVFYCEYSSVRAPRLATQLRNEDRLRSTYPYLLFPNVYIMSGGYKEFYKNYSEFCVPCSYTPM
ncbi:M-phase inducer phosphatase 3 [Nematocida homosporus]|uniref:M-phase inducer phosphatase 3 n=1 Tax=Nematocida homosporus TaxID=1912981 RepID=UPI00221E42D2|nr:M-phase inducer phosphatase 3 [Nematocida homosporus]KAI5187981.1 M-phase inducer phosphatase 3 [Nematocida homosporus]